MPIRQLDLGRALDVQTPLATIASLSRQRGLQEQESRQNELQLQRLALQLSESKKKADDEKTITGIIKAGGTPNEVSRNLLKAGYPDQSRAYLTNANADTLQAQEQARLKIQMETGRETAPQQIGETGTVMPPADMPEDHIVGTAAGVGIPVAAPIAQPAPIPAGYMGAERNAPVTVPYIGQSPSTIVPLNAAEVMRAKTLAEQFKSNMDQRRIIAEANAKIAAERAGKADVKLDETYQDKPDGRHRVIRMQRPDNSQYVIDAGIAAAAPQNPPQPQAPRSAERMKQDEQLKREGKTAAESPDLTSAVSTTRSGLKYVDSSQFTGKERNALVDAANKAGIPAVSKETADLLSEIDNARENLDYMNQTIGSKLAKDPSGRLYQGPANTIEKLMQSDPDLAAVGTYRSAAIQAMRAVAGAKGLRINRAEIEQAQENDIPKITDTLPTAQAKLKNMMKFLDNAEKAHVIRDRSSGTAPTPTKNPFR